MASTQRSRPQTAETPSATTPTRADAMLRTALLDAVRRLAIHGWIDAAQVRDVHDTAKLWLKAHR